MKKTSGKMGMVTIIHHLLLLLGLALALGSEEEDVYNDPSLEDELMPTVMIVLMVRNKAHVLANTLSFLSELDYPKDRITLYVRCDRNQDTSAEILETWLQTHEKEYHAINAKVSSDQYWDDYPVRWTEARFRRLMELKEAALNEARRSWTDFVWFLDADAFITFNETLKDFALSDYVVAAPMLTSIGNYANFWAGMSEDYYYQRAENYFNILERRDLGCFDVPMIHSSVFINLRKSKSKALTFLPENVPGYDGPIDDIITFAISAQFSGISLYVCNWNEYGYIMQPLDENSRLDQDLQNFVNLKLQMIPYINGEFHVEKELRDFLPASPSRDTLGVDQVYLINLKRRPDRKRKMDICFELLGIDYKLIDAVDGKQMSESYLDENNIVMLPGYKDRYHKRPMTYGEIGCFMSHYNIWKDVVENGYREVIVFEDDIRFEPFFREKKAKLMKEVVQIGLDWDLIYLGRKIMENATEPYVSGTATLVHVDYAYWTLGYILSGQGAKKLLDEEPLTKLVPVDEYLPIMYGRHPVREWSSKFQSGKLKAFSASPRLLYPTHYTGEKGYISDTEETPIIASFDVQDKDEL